MTVDSDSVGRRGMGHDDRSGFLSWEWSMVLDRFNPLKWIGLATDQLEDSLPKGYNDHHVPPVDAVYYLLALFAGDGILTLLLEYLGTIMLHVLVLEHGRFGLGPRHLTAVKHTWLGSGFIFYEYEKREKFDDYDMKADDELGTFKIRRYHFHDESFVNPLHSVWFDPDRPFEIPIEGLMADKILSSSKDEKSSTGRSVCPDALCRSTLREESRSSLRKPMSWELIPLSEGWMCDGDDEKEIGGMETSVENEVSSEEDPKKEEEDPEEEELEHEDNPEDEIPATPSLPMDIDAEEDYQCYIEELGRVPEHSPLCNSQASVPDVLVEASNR
ncbi:hypothetical protein PIB30_031945 [Stylosanthes scabra]|uniref:Uncharacterized protein n=1 Tax=Stylosanthes scabra TaxID=79078 RepID=A0ABU6QBK4_9FABA|nr:hypothetical protein [Stylosanthes scabra]